MVRLGLSPLIGYLLAGMLLGGPGSVSLIKAPQEIESIAELGVSLLLFSLGLEFSWNKIKTFPKRTLKAGLLQIFITPAVVLVVAKLLNFDVKIAILFGMIFTLSSTATVLRTLIDLAEVDSAHGRNSTSVLLLQDIAVVPFTIIVSCLTMKGGADTSVLNTLFLTILGALALVLALYVLLNKIASPVLSIFTLENNREMAILLAIVVSIGSAWTAHYIGLSPAIGAFIAGMLLGTSPFATQIFADVAPLRIIFLTLFFSSAGIVADPFWIIENFTTVISLTLLVIFLKLLVSFAIFRFCRNTVAISIASALCISQVGEFAFVLSNIAKEGNLLNPDLYQALVSVTIMSLFVTPFLIKAAPALGLLGQRFIAPDTKLSHDKARLTQMTKADIFILGFGPAGNEVARQLKDTCAERISVIDLNKECVKAASAQGLRAHIGDVRQVEILQHHGLRNARLVIITIPSYDASLRTIDNVKRLSPNAEIMVRSRYQLHYKGFEQAGAHEIVNEELTVGARLGELALEHLSKSH